MLPTPKESLMPLEGSIWYHLTCKWFLVIGEWLFFVLWWISLELLSTYSGIGWQQKDRKGMDFSLLPMCFCYFTLVLSCSILDIFMDNQALAVPGAFHGFEFHLLGVIPCWSANYTSLVGSVHYEAWVRQHDRGGVLLSSVDSCLFFIFSALLSLVITAMLSSDGGDRPWK